MDLVDRVASRLKLRDLRLLDTVVRQGSMAKAAIQLNLSQPAISKACLLYTSPSPRDRQKSRMPSSA